MNSIYVSTQSEPGTKLVFIYSSQLHAVGTSHPIDEETKAGRADGLRNGFRHKDILEKNVSKFTEHVSR